MARVESGHLVVLGASAREPGVRIFALQDRGGKEQVIVKVSGRVQTLFEDTTLLDKGANLTESGLKITITGSASSIVEFEIPELFYEWSSPDVPGPQGLMVDMAFQGFYDNHAEASAIVARVTNGVASYA